MTNSLKEHWHLVDHLAGNERVTAERVMRIMEFSLDHYHRLLLLTAGVVAFVPPLLDQSSLTINPWFLRRGMQSLFVTIALGVVTLTLARTSLIVLLRIAYKQSERLASRVGQAIGGADAAGVDDAIGQAFEDHTATEVAPKERFFWWSAAFLLFWDLVVHASFVYGVWCLFRAAYI